MAQGHVVVAIVCPLVLQGGRRGGTQDLVVVVAIVCPFVLQGGKEGTLGWCGDKQNLAVLAIACPFALRAERGAEGTLVWGKGTPA